MIIFSSSRKTRNKTKDPVKPRCATDRHSEARKPDSGTDRHSEVRKPDLGTDRQTFGSQETRLGDRQTDRQTHRHINSAKQYCFFFPLTAARLSLFCCHVHAIR
ncbi:hypothetical protein ElyMa_002194400 [Elysia marginata]|uniref:Uncharacterized protein n=1 Tax=Elysia marginata TaxID=1093978 RepID=A0AAV4FSC4_9GAST|nr:hypothetical protein ElyMa_002194400 [Elysia marginata]